MKVRQQFAALCLIVSVPLIFGVAQSKPSNRLFKIVVDDKYGFIDGNGKIVIAPEYDDAHDFSEGLAVVAFGAETGRGVKRGFIDATGKLFFKPFESADSFSDGLAPVLVEDKWGYIDKSGELVIAPQFDCVD